MADVRPEIVLDGDISPLRQKLREASAQLKQVGVDGETAFARMTGPLAALQSKFVAIGAILAGGAVFKEAVAQTVKLTEESAKLGRAMGISASEASVLREALEAGNTSQEEFVGASKGLAKQIAANEDGLQAMGLKTRDAAGELRPLTDLTLEALGVLNGYRAGTDRAIAGQTMFGKGFEMTSNLALMNKQAVGEVAEQMRALGMVTSVESVAAWQAYDDAGDKANLTLKGMMTTIGNALMPVLTQLAEWFSAIGPAAVVVIRGAIGGLVSLFWGLKFAAETVWNGVAFAVESATVNVLRFGEVFGRALVFDFSGAAAAWERGSQQLEDIADKRLKNVMDSAEATREKLWNLFAEGTPTTAPGTGGKSAGGLVKTGTAKAGNAAAADPSQMPAYETRLAELKNVYEQEHALRQFSKEQELAYWRELQQSQEVNAKDRISIAKRTATLELEVRRKAVKDEQDLNAVGVEHRRNAALAQVQSDKQAASFALANGQINKSQLLTLEEQFAQRRFEIEYQALLERLELAKNDPNNSAAELARIKEQMLEVERNYQMQRAELGQEKKQEGDGGDGLFDGIGQSFGNATNQMLTRATTWRQQMASIFQSIYQTFVQNLVTKPMGDWIASQARMLAIKMGFLTEDVAATKTASTATATIKGTETTAVVGENAVQAGTGAASALASIPFAGPVLAIAAMAAMYAAVMGMRGKKSAARGYDIPKGLNPMVQTHEEEMILPQKYANVILGLAAGGGQGGEGGGGIVFAPTIKTNDSRDMLRALQDGGVLRKAIEELQRNFVKR